jgi:hypothetical protein
MWMCRKVLDLAPGVNDMRMLFADVHFVHEGGRGRTLKVVVVE